MEQQVVPLHFLVTLVTLGRTEMEATNLSTCIKRRVEDVQLLGAQTEVTEVSLVPLVLTAQLPALLVLVPTTVVVAVVPHTIVLAQAVLEVEVVEVVIPVLPTVVSLGKQILEEAEVETTSEVVALAALVLL